MSAPKGKSTQSEADIYRFRTYGEVGDMFGLSPDAIKALVTEDDFPVFARKISPALMMRWLARNSRRLRDIKVREEKA